MRLISAFHRTGPFSPLRARPFYCIVKRLLFTHAVNKQRQTKTASCASAQPVWLSPAPTPVSCWSRGQKVPVWRSATKWSSVFRDHHLIASVTRPRRSPVGRSLTAGGGLHPEGRDVSKGQARKVPPPSPTHTPTHTKSALSVFQALAANPEPVNQTHVEGR